MIIVKVDTNPQTFEFIPRSKTYDGLFIRDESENIETQITISSSSSNDYYESITATSSAVISTAMRLVSGIASSFCLVYHSFC